MARPTRLRDDPSTGADVQQLLRAAPMSRAMSATQRARTGRRVATLAAIPVATAGLMSLKGIAIAAIVVSGTAAAAKVGYDHLSSPVAVEVPSAQGPGASGAPPHWAERAETAVDSSDEPDIQTPRDSSDDETVLTEVPKPSNAAPSTAKLEPSAIADASADTLAQEAALLSKARDSIASDPAAAMAAIAEHSRTFPRGKLTTERELIALEALTRMGRREEARRRGEALLATSGGIYEQRVRAILEQP